MTKSKYVAVSTAVAACLALASFAGASTQLGSSPEPRSQINAGDVAIFKTTPKTLTDAQLAEKKKVLAAAAIAPEESSARSIDATQLRSVEVSGSGLRVWIAPTSDGGVGIFTPTNDSYAYAHSQPRALVDDGAVSVVSGEAGAAIATVVAVDGVLSPIVKDKSGELRALNFDRGVAATRLQPGDTLSSGGTTIPVVDPAAQLRALNR